MRLQQTYEAHSGYCWEGSWYDKLGLAHSDSAVFHDHHHTVNKGNFGTTYVDYLFGTMDFYLDAGGYEGYLAKGEEYKLKMKKAQ